MPVQFEDYTHRVTFYTDVDQYIMPLIGMGPRPVFDFPDEVVLPKVPLKMENYTFMTVHNIGHMPAGFTLNTRWGEVIYPSLTFSIPCLDFGLVTLTANLIRANQTSLELELEKSDSPPVILPVLFNAMVPTITPAPDIKLRACFIDFCYQNEINITSNEFWGYFTLEEPEEENTLEVNVGVKEGVIKPDSTICLPVSIKTSVLGVQEFAVRGFFCLDPKVFKMAAGEKLELTITGLSYKVTTVKEMWYLVGSVEGINKKELLLECQIIAEFVDPKIELSSNVVEMQYDYGPYSEYYKLTDIITIKNVSKLPLDIDLSVKPPFAIIQKQGSYKILPEEENLCCCICYNESDLNIAHMVNEMGPVQSKIFIDYLTLKPVEPPEISKAEYFNNPNEVKIPTEDTDATATDLNEILVCQDSAATNIEKVIQNESMVKEVCDQISGIESATLDDLELDNEFRRVRTIKKVAPMIVEDYQPEFYWIWKFPKVVVPNYVSINDLLKLTPHRGLLKPNEIQYAHVIFKPQCNINIRAVLECEVLGGPPESIIITGQSSDVMYKINTQKLNFKTRSFHEHAVEELVLSNIAQLAFEYKTYLNEPKFDNELEATIVELIPAEKVLEPEEEIKIKILMRPGVVGYFNRTFLLENGHLPHIAIEVFGWGVIPQVYITLPRPEIMNLPAILGYLAIPALTLDYLEAVSEIFAKTSPEHLNSPLTEKCFEDPNFQKDWHICSPWHGYPSTMDIELAIERMLVIDHIKLRPELLVAYSNTSKMGPIQGFQTIPYVIDYGVVITGSTVQCSAEIINYGPIATKLHFAKGTTIPSWLGIKLCGKLLPGETGKIDVPYGVSIPIQVKALCAVPYLVSNVSEINFGSVRCGDKIVCSVPLKNVGKPTCIWYATLRLKAPGPNPMVILDNSGKFEPEEGGWLSIAFKPIMEMTYDGILIFRFHMNPNRMTIPVTGQGILPQVHIIGPNVNFPPTLPWAETTDIYFGLTNPCPFPIELIIAHSDEKWKEEDDVYQLLYKYYNKPEEMLVPVIRPGEGMPKEIINFYKRYNERVAKAIGEEAATAKAASAKQPTVKKLGKSPKNAAKATLTKESTPRKFRSEAEILADEIKNLKENHVDPLQECLHVFDHISTNSETDKHSKGIIIFVHGSPCEEMQCQEMAYTLGKELDVPTVNIDLCIVEALCISECPARIILVSALNESYNMSRRHVRDDTEVGEENEEVYDETEIKEIIQSFEDMTEEEYENSPLELRLIYINYGLEERRQKHISKLGYPSEIMKKERSGKDRSKSLLIIDGSESKKKIKKEDTKGKPMSEYQVMNSKYNEYTKNTYENLINIANNWVLEECDVGSPLYGFNGQIIGSAQKKAKKKSEIQIQMSDVTYSERGFPLTLIMCPCIRYKEALVEMFKNSTIFQEALKEEQQHNILQCPVNRKEFTVLLPKTFPVIHHEAPLKWRYLDESPIKKCECNPLTDLNLLDDSTQDNVLNILSKWNCTCGKKVTSSQTSTSEIPSTSMEKVIEEESYTDTLYPLPLQSVKSVTVPAGRLVLLPGDLVRCRYSFSPQNEGNFTIKRFVEVSGWPNSRVDINVTGICDLPRIDSRPKKMFENFTRRTTDDNVYKTTYLDDLKIFEFGPIFVGNFRIYEEDYTINLKNSSLITADIEIEFLEDTTVFEIDKTHIKLNPGGRGKLIITAAPTEVGVHICVLLFCVKDNPEIITVNIGCSGVVPTVEILPLTQTIEYGKHLLYRREDDRFIVKNDSILPIMWKIRNALDFIEDFIITQTSGIVLRHDNQVVPVTYIACRVGVISNKMLIIDIYDAEGRGEPMIISNLYLFAECYDVMVDCAYENPSENFLNYGNVKVNSTVSREMYLLNRGKYSVYFKLKKVKNFPEPSLLRSFEVSQECGVIPPTLKLLTLEFECTPATSMNLVNVPVYMCSLLDGNKNQVVVAKFPVCVTIASFYNTFTLFPLGELNFHIIPVGSGVMRDVILNNTSKCPVTYEIVLSEDYQNDPESPPIAMKGKDNKIKNPPMKCGNFLIMNDDNLLAPGTSRTLQIQFMATAARKFEETIKFVISDTCPAEAQGVPLKLVGTGAMPTLDIWNIETTFREHLIVKNLSEYKVPESSPHCVFVENSVTLHFFCVTVNSSFTGTIDLYNNGLVACAITMRLHYQTNSNTSIFSLDKYETHIEPLLHKSLGIIFSPKSLTEYRAVLEIKLKLLDNQEQSFKICLIGEGVIPRIYLVSPLIRQHRIALLQFPVTCLGSVSVKVIRFKNISSVKTMAAVEVLQTPFEGRPIFWVTATANTVISENNDEMNEIMKIVLNPNEIATINVHYNPKRKGKLSCDVQLTIIDNPYEYFTVLCEAEAFMDDVILLGLEMLPMETDLEAYKTSNDGRSVIMVNNSDKVYKFCWEEIEFIVIKPSAGYISPGEEKDLEIMFLSLQPVTLIKELISCSLVAISDDTFNFDMKGSTWDNRQILTVFDHNRDVSINERCEVIVEEQALPPPDSFLGTITIIVVYSATIEFTKYSCTLKEETTLRDTFIYQTRNFNFNVQNTGKVPLKISWNFTIDEEFPTRIDKYKTKEIIIYNIKQITVEEHTEETSSDSGNLPSKLTLFSGSTGRNSADTWFEVDLPFIIEPAKDCLKPGETQEFKVTFSPLDAFDYNVRLKSCIDNLDPYDQNISCRISAKSLIPYCHLDIEESDYLTSGRRKSTGVVLPPQMTVLEFNVLGSGCYKKSFNVINPTNEAYEFIFEMVMSDRPELIPVHCDTLKGYVEGGTSTEVTFTFAPTGPGVYESQWKFIIPVHNLTMNVMVVGLVREPDVVFVPTILIIRNSLVGFTSINTIILKNNETESLKFEFKGNSLCNESGKTPVIVEPNEGVLKARSETPIKIIYTPIQDGPLSFKIFCSMTYLRKYLTLCVNALSYLIKPKVSYYLIGNEHILNSDVLTNIHLDQTASTYERTIPFTIKNDGSATFFFDWYYSGNAVKKYLQISVEPKSGHVTPGNEVECTLFFTVKQVPVVGFPVTLNISDGPEYSMTIHADIEKPVYHFSCKEHDFGKCIINAPDPTYKKNIAFTNEDKVPVLLDLNFANLPELFIDYHQVPSIAPGKRVKVAIYFRPKQVKEYEFKLQFWVNSLCEEIITIKGEGIPLLFDLYEGCQKSYNLGPVKMGEKKVRTIEVMNHSKVPIAASFIFREMYPVIEDTTNSEATSVCLSPSAVNIPADTGTSRVKMLQNYKDDQVRQQIAMDIENALSSLKVIPNKCTIKPYRKVPLKIQFKPVGMIKTLDVQLNMKVFEFERPLVKLSGSATGMSLCFSQNSLQFGRVRKRGCKILKVMLLNKGDFGARFWWQPLISDEFIISPQKGNIAAHTNVTFTITFRPHNHNPFIKVWASCNIENYMPLELAMYATCIDTGNIQNKTLYLESPVREIKTDYVIVTNPSDDMWLILSEVSGGPFDTLREFHVEPNSIFEIPVNFKPKTIGKHEAQILYSPLGESALFVTLIGAATHPNPNSTINITVAAKETHTEELLVYNITEFPESYAVSTELVTIIPDKFEGYYEIKYPETVKVWGEAAATCRWNYVCYEECEMHMKVMFVNEETREYQFYNIIIKVSQGQIVDTLTFVSRARESLQKELVVTNPLSKDADFYIKCDKLLCPDMLRITRNSEAILACTYSPLVVGETEDYLEVNNYLVGTYIYKVILKCLPAKEKNLEFTTELGNAIPIRLRVQNRTEAKTEFVTAVSHPSILVEREYTLGPLEKGKFLVWFEPTELGVQNCHVSFNSFIAGEFIFNIKGIATEPKPQGPYEIKAGGYITIVFKNIFQDLHTFKIYVDREEFYVKTLYEQIKPKKDLKIMVFLSDRPFSGWPVMPTGTLTIENYEPAAPKVNWTYFLQGIP
ncbi:hypothetical protein K1T71_002704 [Dendrolimus kikuchii]|uniref:Uncharacterized protein n=1 Tax=Dendrolimus kikuchii TaxID=765133 RepID=A0ACC1DDL3_9NEOP|nr:hypothetical protein K1T71_002704 [Dendrolimus kikuchii]